MKQPKYKILIVDDNQDNVDSTRGVLEHWGYAVDAVMSGPEALTQLKSAGVEYAVILLDYQMPGMNGAEVATEIRKFNQEAIIAMYSCDDSQEAVILSMRAGAVDFVEKDSIELLRATMDRLCLKFEEGRTLKIKPPADDAEKLIASIGMMGRSAGMAKVASEVIRCRQSQNTVLITGESGTGKELVAQALHLGKGSFVAINCAQFNAKADLLESTLFGHEKGAFTGATTSKIGLLESARGGTVFLDEIHHMSLGSQAQLLRAVQTKQIRRMGGNVEYPIDFRLIAATKPEIKDWVEQKTFSSDLYYRLRCLCIEVPPLRSRPEDIEPLIAFFSEKNLGIDGKKKIFLMRTVRMMEAYDWPGNVRDLENYVIQLVTGTDSDTIDPSQLAPHFFVAERRGPGAMQLSEFELEQEKARREFILAALKTSKSVAHGADRLGVPATTLRSMLDKLGIARKEAVGAARR